MKITVIGGGNMGGAVARGAVSKGVVKATDVTIADPSKQVQQLFKEFNPQINISDDNASAVEGADVIVVAVKPWLVAEVLEQIAHKIDAKRQILISIAAGITFSELKSYLTAGVPALFRVIPNTAISLAQSATFVCSEGASAEQCALVENLFGALGRTFVVEEEQMTAVTALASCGIAYIFKYIDASTQGGVEMGIDREMAQRIVMQTVRGALAMLETNGSTPQMEIDKVTTPGGITLKGLEKMAECGFSESLIEGLKASK